LNELEFKNSIIKNLINDQQIVRKHTNQKDFKTSEDFIRGYIMGAECATSIKLPSYWYNDIIKAVREA
jgi:hypothetical protein